MKSGTQAVTLCVTVLLFLVMRVFPRLRICLIRCVNKLNCNFTELMINILMTEFKIGYNLLLKPQITPFTSYLILNRIRS